jgi:hypothetical protein
MDIWKRGQRISMAVGYFPPIRPHQILYSAIACYNQHVQNISIRAVTEELFGKKHLNVHAIIDLPNKIDLLIQNTPLHRSYSAGYLIEKHTLFNYYAPFIGESGRKCLKMAMRGNGGNKLKCELGLQGKRLFTPKELKMCSKCVEEDISTYGEPFWHVEHQAPAVTVCYLHETPLLTQEKGKYEYKYLHFDNDKQQSKFANNDQLLLHLNYAQDVARLLADPRYYEPEHLYLVYKQGLYKMGFLSKGNCVRLELLIESFINYFGHEYLESLNCAINSKQNSWLAKMFRRPAHMVPPVHHILVIRFLFGSMANFLSESWPADTSLVPRKMKNNPRPSSRQRINREEYRKVILAILARNQASGVLRADLIREAEKEFTWLRRNDKSWFEENLPKPLSAKETLSRKKDWGDLDNKYCRIVESIVDAIRVRLGKPIRVTTATIIKYNTELKGLRDKLFRLPKTKECLNSALESVEDFQIRRLRWVAQEAKVNGELVSESKLKTRAGLYHTITPRIEQIIQEELRNFENGGQ